MSKQLEAQRNQLISILRKQGETTLFSHYGLADMPRSGAIDKLYNTFKERVPLMGHDAYVQKLAELTGNYEASPEELFLQGGLISKSKPAALARESGTKHYLPVTADHIKQFAQARSDLTTAFKKQRKASLKGMWFHLPKNAYTDEVQDVERGDLMALQMSHAGFFERKKMAPELYKIQSVGKSRNHTLLAYGDELEQLGENVSAIVADARTLTELSFLMAQREGRFIPLKEICPNVGMILLSAGQVGQYARELGYFLSGLNCSISSFIIQATGFAGYADDVNLRHQMRLQVDGDTFYEFIPVEDLDKDGLLKKEPKRLHVGELKKDKQYLVAVTNMAGLLGYVTGDVIKVISTEPLRVRWMRRQKTLNGFGEALTTTMVESLLEEMNNALQTYGFFIREYMVGDDIEDKTPQWVLEVSRPLKDIPEKVLRSIANRLHTELGIASGIYKTSFKSGVFPPQLAIVPMGTFSSMPRDFEFSNFDTSKNAGKVKQVINRAQDKRILRAPLLS